MLKKWLPCAILLAALLVFCIGAQAEPSIVSSGTCGRALKWTLDSEGTLTISGSGEMKDYNYYYDDDSGSNISNAPWFSNRDSIQRVVVESGVTSIGDSAFWSCSSLTSINLPDGVTSIGSSAFYGCSSLTSINIPDGVTSIGSQTFRDCDSLTSINIPDGVTSIGDNAFYECDSLTSINIPDGVTSIGDSAFWCCYSLSSITIPDGVTSIGDSTFAGCSSLTNINIPDGVTSIGDSAFSSCSSLTSITLPAGVTSIGSSAFSSCSSLSSVTLPAGTTSIGDFVFANCDSLTSITIPDGVTSIGNSAFQYCDSLTSITIPDGVTSIGNDAFGWCHSLNTVYADSLAGWLSIAFGNDESYPFCNHSGSLYIGNELLTDAVVPEGITSIGDYAFSGCDSLSSITLPDGLVSIGDYAFSSCDSLSSVILPDGVTSIGNSAFRYCDSLSSITLPDGLVSVSIGKYAFQYCDSLTSIILPDGLTSIGGYAFQYCHNLKQLVFLGQSMPSLYIYDTEPTIYCYEYSDVDFWATNQGYEIVYLDDMDLSIPWSLTLPKDRSIAVGESLKISADLFPAQKNPEITWISSDPAVVSVENGLLRAHASGDAIITANHKNLEDSISIHAYVALESFDLSESEIWIPSKTSFQLSVQNLLPEDAETYFTWTYSNSNILTVNQSGLISALAPGDARVIVTSDRGIMRECLVHVCYPVTAIAFETAEMELVSGEAALLQAKVSTRTQDYVNRLVEFASSDSSVVSVDASGKITAHIPGEASITATAQNGISAVCRISVYGEKLLTLPKGLKQIEAEAFIGAPIQDVALPDGVVEIGARAFAECADLQFVRMPDSVISIAEDAFDGCEQLRFICASENAAAAYAQAHGIPYSIP